MITEEQADAIMAKLRTRSFMPAKRPPRPPTHRQKRNALFFENDIAAKWDNPIPYYRGNDFSKSSGSIDYRTI